MIIKFCLQYIEGFLRNLNWTLTEDTFTSETPLGRTRFSNVIATHNPNAVRRVMLAAHYESKREPAGFVGASDSAVPCAMLLALAEALTPALTVAAARQTSLDDSVSLQLVFFDGEEAFNYWTAQDSLYGSRHLAQLWSFTRYTFPDSLAGSCSASGQQSRLTELDRIVCICILVSGSG